MTQTDTQAQSEEEQHPAAARIVPDAGPSVTVDLPAEVQALLVHLEAQRLPAGERLDVDAVEQQVARAAAEAVERVWLTAIADVQGLYPDASDLR